MRDIACHECDLLIVLPSAVDSRETLCCPRCKHKIIKGHKAATSYVIALAFSALIMLIIANSLSFISLNAKGQSADVSLLAAAWQVYELGYFLLAVSFYCFAVLLPAFYLILLLLLLIPLKLGSRPATIPYWRIVIAKWISHLLPWSMSEVFLIAVLVSLIKLVAMADIILGLSFWAYVVFVVAFSYIVSIVDSIRLWCWVEYENI